DGIRDFHVTGVQTCALPILAATGKGNLLEAAVACARERASLGEISSAMEKTFGRYQATIRSISGVYAHEAMKDNDFITARTKAEIGRASCRERVKISGDAEA